MRKDRKLFRATRTEVRNGEVVIFCKPSGIGGFWLWLKSKYSFNDSQIRKKTISLAPFLKDTSSIQQGYLTSEPYLFEQITGEQPKVFLMADYGYPSYGAMILASNDMIMQYPKIVQDFVDASIEGWIDYIYGDPSLGNNLILSENNEMTEEVLFQAIRKIREYNMISSEASLRDDIGQMSEEKWKNFFNIMSENGVYDKELEWRDAFTLDFIEKGN